MKKYKAVLFIILVLGLLPFYSQSQRRGHPVKPRFSVLVLAENGGHHIAYSQSAKGLLDKIAALHHFRIDYISNTDSITKEYLKRYRLFIQLDYPPYGWKPEAVSAFEDYIDKGMGGWIGFHHASLLGEFDGTSIWPWFYDFMGGIRFKDYIGDFSDGTVHIEKRSHPIFKGLPDTFTIHKEEWYTYDKSPRGKVKVLANVDEASYSPVRNQKMGDHPVIWTNPAKKARNVYIFMGHSPELFYDMNYVRLFNNAIVWAAKSR